MVPNDCTRGALSPCCSACYLMHPLCHPGERSFVFFTFFIFYFLFFIFRNWPLVTGVQSRECCGFLEVNLWPRTERTCRRSKVRDTGFCLHRYFLISLYICAMIPGFLGWNHCVLNNVISSKNEVLCVWHVVHPQKGRGWAPDSKCGSAPPCCSKSSDLSSWNCSDHKPRGGFFLASVLTLEMRKVKQNVNQLV